VGINSQSIVEVFQTLGAETVVIDWTESYSNLDKGVVDSVSAGTTYMWIAELYKVGKYSTWMSGIAGNYGIHINLDIWNAMPADIQQILDEEVKACCLELNQTHVDIQESNKQTLVDGGCEVFIPDDAERDKWKAACESYVTEKLAGYGDFGTQFMAIVDEANAANP
jgi:TRAP-type C4-dicarboxylate transport system substrate-binding protein